MTKKYLIILSGIILFLFLSYKKVMPIINAKSAFQKAKLVYDLAIVQNCERIFRLETNNFLSNQFSGTNSPGMEPGSGKTAYPYGWNSLKSFWDLYPEYKPIGLKTYTENGTGIRKSFIEFPSVEAAVFTVCNKLVLNGNNAGGWFSTDKTLQYSYENKLSNINPSFTNA